MAFCIFTCPNTSLPVQQWVEGGDVAENEYRSIVCNACTKVHFINPMTGKVLGQREESSKDLTDS